MIAMRFLRRRRQREKHSTRTERPQEPQEPHTFMCFQISDDANSHDSSNKAPSSFETLKTANYALGRKCLCVLKSSQPDRRQTKLTMTYSPASSAVL